MKKLMMAVAIVCAAAFAQAGAINWGSGAIQTPGADGALSGTKLTSSSGYSIQMYVWESLTASDVAYNAGDLFSMYTSGTTTLNGIDAIHPTITPGATATTATAYGSELTTTGGANVYAAVLFVLEDSTGAAWYMENSAVIGAKAGGTKATLGNLALKEGGTGAATSWTAAAIPEPTSALLLLLGMAGLALKRKQA